jgi:hypothetical protein
MDKPLSPVHRRLIEPLDDESGSLSFLHSVLCQTSLPYRDPGAEILAGLEFGTNASGKAQLQDDDVIGRPADAVDACCHSLSLSRRRAGLRLLRSRYRPGRHHHRLPDR